MRKTLFLFLLMATCWPPLLAQRYAFKNYTTNDGLVQTDVTDIKQDKKGNIWIGTNGGLSIFDGKTFTNYDDHDVLQSLRINALLCDSGGTMWIATLNGLLRYRDHFEVFFKATHSRNNVVSSLATDSKNNLYFVCNNKAFVVRDNKAAPFKIDGRVDGKIVLLGCDREDNFWVVTNDMSVFKKNAAGVTAIRSPFSQGERQGGLGFMKILGREGPEPFFVTNFGTLRADGDSLQYFTKKSPQYAKAKIGQATYVLQNNDSSLWVGGAVGLSKISPQTVTRYTSDNGFCDNSVSCLFTDREKNLWIGCTYNGVYKLSNEALFHLKPSTPSFDLKHVSATLPLSDGRTLLATWGKGLYLYNGDSVRRVALPPQVRYITSLLQVGNRICLSWFGQGLWWLDSRTLAYAPVKGFAEEQAVGRLQKVGANLLVTTMDRSYYLTDENFQIKQNGNLPDDGGLVAINNRVYSMNAFGQVNLLNDNFEPIKKNLFPEVSSRITDITPVGNAYLVATFGQGLFFYGADGRLQRRLDKKSGQPTNIITSLLVDGSEVFAGTNLGLIKLELPDLEHLKVFKESEGMFNWECRPGGLTKLPDGALLIATTNGPYIYHANRDPSPNYAAGVLSFAGFAYGDNNSQVPLSDQSSLQLPEPIGYPDNNVTITLKGVSQRNLDDIQYHYQLAGYDSAWVSTANRVLSFRNLAPGTYRLNAYLSIGSFQSSPVQASFTIARPLSGTWWFQVLLVLVLSAICWVLLTMGNRIYQKYIQSRMISRLETEIAVKQELTGQALSFARREYKELSDALRLANNRTGLESLTPIFLKDVSRRIDLLWKQEKLSLEDLHAYFDELLADYNTGARLYHKLTLEGVQVPVAAAFHLMQVFSLYLFIGLHESGSAVFSLDSENKSNGQLLLRLYNLTHDATVNHSASYCLLKETINRQRSSTVTLDVIENLEFGNMIVAELNLQNEWNA